MDKINTKVIRGAIITVIILVSSTLISWALLNWIESLQSCDYQLFIEKVGSETNIRDIEFLVKYWGYWLTAAWIGLILSFAIGFCKVEIGLVSYLNLIYLFSVTPFCMGMLASSSINGEQISLPLRILFWSIITSILFLIFRHIKWICGVFVLLGEVNSELIQQRKWTEKDRVEAVAITKVFGKEGILRRASNGKLYFDNIALHNDKLVSSLPAGYFTSTRDIKGVH